MKVYRVIVHTTAFEWYHFATKQGAVAFRSGQIADLRGEFENMTAEIEVLRVTPTRDGIVKLLNDFVSETCMNEN